MVDALQVTEISYSYPDGRRAVDGVTFSVHPGESVGLVGPNGAGKTTLLLLLAGLLDPASGGLQVLGGTYGGKDERNVRRRLGFVFQETEDQLFSPTVFDDVAFGVLNFAPPGKRRDLDGVRESVASALAQVGLSGYEDRVPHHLSSGERRRVALATVLSYEPDVLVLDEPSNDLDPKARRRLADLLRSTSQARLIASHDLEFVLRTCGRVLVMDGGRLQADGDAVDLLCDAPLLDRHGLAVPMGLAGLGPAAVRDLLAGG